MCFNHEEYCDELYLHRKTCAFAIFPCSGGLFEGRVALGPPRKAPFGPPRRSPTGFRRFRWRPHHRQKCQNPATDPQRRKPTGGVAPLPGKPSVGHATTCQPKLRVSGDHQPRPPIGLLGMPHTRGGPSKRLLEGAKGVLRVEAPWVGAPEQFQVRRGPLGTVPPQATRPAARAGSRRAAASPPPPGPASRARSAWGHGYRGPRGLGPLGATPPRRARAPSRLTGVLAGVLSRGLRPAGGVLALELVPMAR